MDRRLRRLGDLAWIEVEVEGEEVETKELRRREEGSGRREEQGESGWADAAPSRGRCIILGPKSRLLSEDRRKE